MALCFGMTCLLPLCCLPGPVHVYALKPSAHAAQFCEMMRGMQSSTIKRATTAYRKGAIL